MKPCLLSAGSSLVETPAHFNCGCRITALPDFSKVVTGVRLPSPALYKISIELQCKKRPAAAGRFLNCGVYLRFRSNLLYQKFLKKSTRSAPPPAAEYGGLPRRKTFFTIFNFARPRFFLLKRKRKFFCSAPRSPRGAAGLRFGSRARRRGVPGEETPCPLVQNVGADFWAP